MSDRFNLGYQEGSATARRRGLERFQEAVGKNCRALHVCREIANGSKHMRKDQPDPDVKATARWHKVIQGAGFAVPGDLLMSLMISDGKEEVDAVLWYIDASGYWENLMRDEKLIKIEDRLPDKIIRPAASE